MARKRPVTVAARVDHEDRAILDTAARLEGTTISDLIYTAVMPVARERVRRALHSQPRDRR